MYSSKGMKKILKCTKYSRKYVPRSFEKIYEFETKKIIFFFMTI